MEKEELMKDLKTEFEKMKKELKFKSSFKDVNDIFFLDDAVLTSGFVSPNLSRQVCHRIVDTYMSWVNYFHGLIMPNTSYLPSLNESKMVSEEKRKELLKLMSETITLISANSVIGLSKNKSDESAFIDQAVEFWNTRFKDSALITMKMIAEGWKKK